MEDLWFCSDCADYPPFQDCTCGGEGTLAAQLLGLWKRDEAEEALKRQQEMDTLRLRLADIREQMMWTVPGSLNLDTILAAVPL